MYADTTEYTRYEYPDRSNEIKTYTNPIHNDVCPYVDLAKVKGILKQSNLENDNVDIDISDDIIQNMTIFCILVVSIPIISCDFNIGCRDDVCVNDTPTNINIDLRTYLLVSASVNLLLLLLVMVSYYYLPTREIHNKIKILKILPTISSFVNLITFTINIIGIIIFWINIYNSDECDGNTSTYIFITLVIKIVTNVSYIVLYVKCNGS